ncbi:MAG TPA: VOC family protein [Candidatus Acidoferrales bacterium]|nr:VOC family protein [Candidatus Acidoferrales bacterium]
MGRLHCVLLLTPDIERQRAFYRERLGLEASRSDDALTVFAVAGAALVLQPQVPGAKPELRLAVTAVPLEARVAALVARSVPLEGGIVEQPTGRVAVLRDPEGTAVQLVEPTAELAPGRWPRLSHAIINAAKFDATVAFYREVVGLKVADEDERWVEFETGETRLTVHDRADNDSLALYADQRLAFAFEDAGFETWTEELRKRGVAFATAPAETELGPQAEVEDADGWFVVLHGPAPEEPPDEDELDREYGEDDDTRGLPRRGGELGSEATRRTLPAAKVARKQAARSGARPAPEPDRGGFVPRGFSGPPRFGPPRPPGFAGPRPAGPGGPRPSGPAAPRPAAPAGPPRPPRPDRDPERR